VSRGRWAVLLVAVAALATACSIKPDSSPQVIPVGDHALNDTFTAEGGEAAGSTRVFLVKEGDDGTAHLTSVLRSVDPTATAVMQELLKGPNAQEEDAGVTSALPRDLVLRSARSGAGVLTVDVSSQLLDEPAPKLLLAIAQIVFTASELEGVREVRIKVNGTIRPWPDGQGELRTTALTVYDYPGIVESSQPPYPAIPTPEPAS
jgi:Sporulation and spore germination